MRRVLLFLLYILVFTPFGLAARAVRDPMRRRLDPRAPSYWAVSGAGARRR